MFGLDITGIESGDVEVVFDYWVGDDVGATIFVDDEGSSMYRRNTSAISLAPANSDS